MTMCVNITALETKRLILEPLVSNHADELFDLFQDQNLYVYLEDTPPESLDLLRKRYEFLSERRSGDGKQLWLNWVPREKETGKVIGYFETSIEGNDVSIGYFVFAAHQRQGLAKEGLREIIGFLSMAYSIQRFVIEMDTRNLASARLAGALGFDWVRTTNKAAFFKGHESHEFRFELSPDPGGEHRPFPC